MPQFDTTTFAGQIFWLVLSFGLLYVLVSRVILPKFISIVDQREDRISQDIRAAKDLQKEIDYLQAKVAETKRQAIHEVTDLYDKEKRSLDDSFKKEFLEMKHHIHAEQERFVLDLAERQKILKETFALEAPELVDQVLKKVANASLPTSEIEAVTKSVARDLSVAIRG
jgi:F-type H+-transporting ATPase subunit b